MPPPGFQETLLEGVQIPPSGQFTSADLNWTKSSRSGHGHYIEVDIAHIPSNRVEEFVAGEAGNIDGGTRFNKAALRRHEMGSLAEPRVGSYTTFTRYMCAYGPEDWRVNTPTPRAPQPPLEAGKKARRKRVDNGESVKRGCLCSFGVKQLYASPNVSEIVYYRREHTDARGMPCHGLMLLLNLGPYYLLKGDVIWFTDVPKIWQLPDDQIRAFKNLINFRSKIANEVAKKAVTNELLFRIAEKMPDSVTTLLDVLTEQEKESVVGGNAAAFVELIQDSKPVSLERTSSAKNSPHVPYISISGSSEPNLSTPRPPSPDPAQAEKYTGWDKASNKSTPPWLSHAQQLDSRNQVEAQHQMVQTSLKTPSDIIGLDDAANDEKEKGTPRQKPLLEMVEGTQAGPDFAQFQARLNNLLPTVLLRTTNRNERPEGGEMSSQRTSASVGVAEPESNSGNTYNTPSSSCGVPLSPFFLPPPLELNVPPSGPATHNVEFQPAIQICGTPVPLVPFQVMIDPLIFAPLASRLPAPPLAPTFQYLHASPVVPPLPIPPMGPQFHFHPPDVFRTAPPPVPIFQEPEKPKRKRVRKKRVTEPGNQDPPKELPPPPQKPQLTILDALNMYHVTPCLFANIPSVSLLPYSSIMAASHKPSTATALAGLRKHMKDPTLLVPVVVPAGYQPVYIPPASGQIHEDIHLTH